MGQLLLTCLRRLLVEIIPVISAAKIMRLAAAMQSVSILMHKKNEYEFLQYLQLTSLPEVLRIITFVPSNDFL